MGTTQEAWQKLKADPVKYEQAKKQVMACHKKKRQQAHAVFLDLKRQEFLTNLWNWDRDKHLLSDTYRQVLSSYYGLDDVTPISLTELALQLGISKQCVANKKERAIKRLVKLQTD
jgi:DNA-directed RNA polymerase sigma subunit (sigma70/sigma32)